MPGRPEPGGSKARTGLKSSLRHCHRAMPSISPYDLGHIPFVLARAIIMNLW